MTVDLEQVEQLLNIADMTRHWPSLKPIHDYSVDTLESIANAITKEKEDGERHPEGVRTGEQQATSSPSQFRRHYSGSGRT